MSLLHSARGARSILIASALTMTMACAGSTPSAPVAPTEPVPVASEAQPVADPEAFRAQQPEPGAPRPFQLPSMVTFTLDNGVDVYLVEQHAIPTVSMSLVFDGGSMNDPRRKAGTASICMSMMTESTRSLDKVAYNEALADIAASISSYAATDTQGLSLRSLTKHFDHAFELFAQTLSQPGMRKADFDRMIERSLESLKQAKGSAGSVAGRVGDSILFGAEHPFGQITTEKSLRSLKLDDCKKYLQAYIRPRGARLFVVGDQTEAQIRAKFTASLPKWSGKAVKSVELPKPIPQPGRVFFVDIPGSAQSTVQLTHFGPERKAGDYFANTLASAVLGGGFSSRVNMNLRENKGYSYGARGGFSYSRAYGVFSATSSVRTDATRQSVIELLGEIRAIHSGERPITEGELSREREGRILSMPASFASAREALARYRDLVHHDLPLDYYNTYVEKLGAVTLDQAMRSARLHLRPSDVQILVVGDANATMIVHTAEGKDEPLVNAEGHPVTLLDSLKQLVESGSLGTGALVELDVNGKILTR